MRGAVSPPQARLPPNRPPVHGGMPFPRFSKWSYSAFSFQNSKKVGGASLKCMSHDLLFYRSYQLSLMILILHPKSNRRPNRIYALLPTLETIKTELSTSKRKAAKRALLQAPSKRKNSSSAAATKSSSRWAVLSNKAELSNRFTPATGS